MGKKQLRKRLDALEQQILTLELRVLTLEQPPNPAEQLARRIGDAVWTPVTELYPSSGVIADVGGGYQVKGVDKTHAIHTQTNQYGHLSSCTCIVCRP